jgi:PAS domain S-box-containing protein
MATGHRTVGALSIAPESSSVGAARRFVEQRLADTGLVEDVIETAVLLTSELVTNAVIHAGTELHVRVSVGVGVLVEVRDETEQLPLQRNHSDDAVGGRGLDLVELLADNFGVVPIAGAGKSVWFVVGDPGGAVRGGWATVDTTSSSSRVILRHLPLVLYDVMQEHHEALLREYTLQLLDRAGPRSALLIDVAAADRARQMIAAAVSDWRTTCPAFQTVSHFDLAVEVSPDNAAGFERFTSVVDSAEEQAALGRLLTRPALPEIAALRRWLFGQIVGQLDGGKSAAWEFADSTTALPSAPVGVDTAWVAGSEHAVIVADDANLIVDVSAAAAALLGWTRAALLGQRLTAIIPSRLQEAHIAGFTRQLVTGRRHVLDSPIQLPGLRRDGYEILLTVTLTRQTVGDRAVFWAWLSP